MTFSLIDIIPLVLFALIAYKAEIIRGGQENLNPNYLSLETGKSLRGIFSIFVVLRHLVDYTKTGHIFPLNEHMGFLAVAIFFFLSGYGLMKQHLNKDDYSKGFLKKRIAPILVPYILINIAYWLMFASLGTRLSIIEILGLFIIGKPMAQYSWYIISILTFYLVFWAIIKLFKKEKQKIIIASIWFCFINLCFCKIMGWPIQWYSTTHLLVLGMLWTIEEDKIITAIKKRYYPTITISIILCIVLFALKVSLPGESLLLRAFLGPIFVFFVLLVCLKIKIGNPILNFLGEISLETYLSHGIFIIYLKRALNIQNDFLYAVCVITSTIAFATLFHRLNQKICSKRNVKPSPSNVGSVK